MPNEKLSCGESEYAVEGIKQKISYWFSIASPNGFNRLAESKFKLRVFWFVVISACYAGMIVHLSFNFQQFFSFKVATSLLFENVQIKLPDITVCRIGTPPEVLKNQPKLMGIRELLFRFSIKKIPSLDKLRYRDFYLARVANFRNPNVSTENIGQYLILCNYGGELCDFRNFTLLRDPFFYNCFTFTPNDRSILLSGKVLTLGLHADTSGAIEHDDDFLVVFHEQDTRPEILLKHYVVPKASRTQITFSMTEIRTYSRLRQRCKKNATIKYLYTLRNKTFKYTKLDCFYEILQEEMVKNCSCISPYGGVLQRFEQYQECHNIPPLNEHQKTFLHYARLYEQEQNGEPTTAKAPKWEDVSTPVKNAEDSCKVLIRNLVKNITCHEKVMKMMVRKYGNLSCDHSCVRNQISTTLMNRGFRAEDLKRIGQFLIPNKSERRSTKNKLKEHGLYNNVANATFSFAEEQYEAYWGKKRANMTKKKRGQILSRAFREMAMLEIYINKVPGDAIVETPAYPFFKLLSDIGGNMGLWAGFSIISLFEVVELFMMIIGRGRKKRRIKHRHKSARKSNNNVRKRGYTSGMAVHRHL